MTNYYPTDTNHPASPLSIRILLSKEILDSGKKLIVFIYGKPDASTFRYRVYNICQSLADSENIAGVYFYQDELSDNLVTKIILKASFVTVVRVAWSFDLENTLRSVKAKTIPVIFDTDDLVFDIKKAPMISNIIHADLEWMINYIAKINLSCQFADFFTTSTHYLKNRLQVFFGKPTFVVPNSFNEEQLSASYRTRDKQYFDIGYFSGSPSHYNDLLVCIGDIIDFMSIRSDVRFLIYGYMEIPDQARKFVSRERIIYKPFTDYINLQREIANVDLNVAPLVINEFTNCKSELKFFEAAIANVPSCVSPTEVYKKCIVDNCSGYLCYSGEWLEKLEEIYSNNEGRAMVIENAKRYALEKYSPTNLMKIVENVYFSINLKSR